MKYIPGLNIRRPLGMRREGTPEIQANTLPAYFKLSCPVGQVFCLNLQFNETLWILPLNMATTIFQSGSTKTETESRNQISMIEN